MEVSKSDAKGLLIDMGFDKAAVNGWSDEKLTTKLNALPDKYEKGENDPKKKDMKKLLKSILSAIEDDEEEIELTAEKKSKKGKSKEEDEEEEEEDKPKKKKGKKSKERNVGFKKAGAPGKPGIVATIYDIISKTSKEKPTTKEKVLDILEKKFPDRERDSMAVTVYSQLAFKMPTVQGWPIKKTGGADGKFYWGGKPLKKNPYEKGTKKVKEKDDDEDKPAKKKKKK